MSADQTVTDSAADADHDAELESADHEMPGEPAAMAAIDPALNHWLDFFHRYHQSQALRPVTRSMEPELVLVSETLASRYVFEVAVRHTGANEEWLLLAWEIDVPGIRIRTCESREDAMDWYARREIHGPKVATVRLGPQARPW